MKTMTNETYRAVRDEVSKDAGKALITFFVVLPLAFATFVFFIMSPVKTSLALLAVAGAWKLYKLYGGSR